jgi:hypothetical protein
MGRLQDSEAKQAAPQSRRYLGALMDVQEGAHTMACAVSIVQARPANGVSRPRNTGVQEHHYAAHRTQPYPPTSYSAPQTVQTVPGHPLTQPDYNILKGGMARGTLR